MKLEQPESFSPANSHEVPTNGQLAEQLKEWQAAQGDIADGSQSVGASEQTDDTRFARESLGNEEGVLMNEAAKAWEDVAEPELKAPYSPEEAEELVNTIEALQRELDTQSEDGSETVAAEVETEPADDAGATEIGTEATGETEPGSEMSGTEAIDTENATESMEPMITEATAPVVETDRVLEKLAADVRRAASAVADIELAYGNAHHQAVTTAHVMYDFIKAHLKNKPPFNPEVDQSTELAGWEAKLAQKTANLLEHKKGVLDTTGKKTLEDPDDVHVPNVFELQPHRGEVRRAEIMVEAETLLGEVFSRTAADTVASPNTINDPHDAWDPQAVVARQQSGSESVEAPPMAATVTRVSARDAEQLARDSRAQYFKQLFSGRRKKQPVSAQPSKFDNLAALGKTFFDNDVIREDDARHEAQLQRSARQQRGFFARWFGR